MNNLVENNNSSEKRWKLVNFCEFDKYAVKSYCAIHDVDESLNLGDITKVDEHNITSFNMICGGSPCQDFSVAGKQKGSVWTCKDCGHEYNPLTVHWSERDKCPECGSNNIEKTRSSLLVEYLRVIIANKPNFGMYENVKNIVGKQFKETTFKLFTDELKEYGYNVYWKVLNAKDYGVPQNRERVYLIFIKKELDNGTFKYPEPFDNGIRLKDVLENEVDEKFYISEEKGQKFIQNLHIDKNEDGLNTPNFIGNVNRNDFGTGYAGGVWNTNNISPTLTTMQGGGRQPHIIATKCIGNINPSGKGMNGNVFDENGLAPTLTTNKGEGNKIAIRQATKKGYIECEIGGVADLSCLESKTRRCRVQDGGNICPTLTATETGVCRIESVNEFNNKPKERFFRQALDTFNDSNAEYGDTIDAFNKRINKSGCSPTLTTRPEGFKTAILPVTNDIRIRKLTPKECFRLMGFSDENFEAAEKMVSNSQLYKQAGNSIVVDVLYYILVELYKAMPYLFDDLKLSSFFSGIGAFEIALNRLYESINSGNFTKPQAD